jgi:hypothetical protein
MPARSVFCGNLVTPPKLRNPHPRPSSVDRSLLRSYGTLTLDPSIDRTSLRDYQRSACSTIYQGECD